MSAGACGRRAVPVAALGLALGLALGGLLSDGALCAQAAEPAGPEVGRIDDLPLAPAGVYALDPSHASLVFRIDHIGLSRFTARFTDFDAALTFDPTAPDTEPSPVLLA